VLASILLIAAGIVRVTRCSPLVFIPCRLSGGTWVYFETGGRPSSGKWPTGYSAFISMNAEGCSRRDHKWRGRRTTSFALITRTGRRRTVGSDLMRGCGLQTPRLSVGTHDRHGGHPRIRTRVRTVRLMPLLKVRGPGGQFGPFDHAHDRTHLARDTSRVPAAGKYDHGCEREQRQEPQYGFTRHARRTT